MTKRKICVVTGTRAEYGLLRWVMDGVQKAQELELQITSMRDERADLLAATARLRHGISQLNREGRERLMTAFETVNGHFQELFVKLFGGGKAYLTLTEAEDPLESGLEIMEIGRAHV